MTANILPAILGFASGMNAMHINQANSKWNNGLMHNYLDNEEANLTNLFNKEYYKNYMESGNNAAALSMMRRLNQESTDADRASSVVMGGTPELAVANTKARTDSYNKFLVDLTMGDNDRKDRLLQNYAMQKGQYADRRFNLMLNQNNQDSINRINDFNTIGEGITYLGDALFDY